MNGYIKIFFFFFPSLSLHGHRLPTVWMFLLVEAGGSCWLEFEAKMLIPWKSVGKTTISHALWGQTGHSQDLPTKKKRQGSEGAIKCKDVPWRFTIWRCSGFPIPRLTCLLQKIREAESNNPSAQTTSGHCWNGGAAPQQPHPTRSLAGNWQPRCLHQPQGRRAEWASVARTKQQPFRMQSGSQSPLIVQSTKLILAVWNQSPSPRRSGITHDLLLGATLARSRAARTSSAQAASAHCRVRACAPASLP